jgi:hypothetical protein
MLFHSFCFEMSCTCGMLDLRVSHFHYAHFICVSLYSRAVEAEASSKAANSIIIPIIITTRPAQCETNVEILSKSTVSSASASFYLSQMWLCADSLWVPRKGRRFRDAFSRDQR